VSVGSVAIWCGRSFIGDWGPWSLEETGIGGSEEAVVRLSRELVRFGWDVTVYASPGSRAGVHDGVEWQDQSTFDPGREFDVMVVWRRFRFLDTLASRDVRARKVYLWLHEVPSPQELCAPERLALLTKVIFVSEFHASLYREFIPPDKMFVSGNGIDAAEFERDDGRFPRERQRCIYTSAHDRGLEILYGIWPAVRQAVPDATLHVYYGWEVFDAIARMHPARADLEAWKAHIVELGESLEGVVDHGRVPQDRIVEATFKSDVFAYPCTFWEVYCISLTKAMAGGAYPVTSDFAVLGDFNRWGARVAYDAADVSGFADRYQQALIDALRRSEYPDRSRMMSATRENSTWRKVAAAWDAEFAQRN
jgi:hypothetical protein